MAKPEQGLRPLTWADGAAVTRGADGSEEVGYSQPVNVDTFPAGGGSVTGRVSPTNGEPWVSLMCYPAAGATFPANLTVLTAQLSNDGVTFPASAATSMTSIYNTTGVVVNSYVMDAALDPQMLLFQTDGAKYYRITGTPDTGSTLLVASCPGFNADLFPRATATNVGGFGIAVSPSLVTSAGTPGKYFGGYTVLTNAGLSNTPVTGTGTLDTVSRGWIYNGVTWDSVRSPSAFSLLASAARTATIQSSDETNFNWGGVRLVLNITVASGTGGLQVQLLGKDSANSSAYYAVNTAPSAIVTTGTFAYDFFPGSLGTASGAIQQSVATVIPRIWAAKVTAGDASSYTYSLSAEGVLT